MRTGTTPLIAAWATAVPPWGATTAVRGVTQVASAVEHPAKTNRCHLQTEDIAAPRVSTNNNREQGSLRTRRDAKSVRGKQ